MGKDQRTGTAGVQPKSITIGARISCVLDVDTG